MQQELIEAVCRARPGSPSKLGTLGLCPLRYVLETENLTPSLMRPHPTTLLGIAMHEVTEALLSGSRSGATTHLAMLEERVGLQLGNTSRIGPVAAWVMARFGVRGLLPRRLLVEKANLAKSLAMRFAGRSERRTETITKAQAEIPIGSEKWLASSVLGVAGKVDLICRDADRSIRIVDFKSGRVTDDGVSPKPAYLMQIAVYGRMAKELEPENAVRLELIGKIDTWSGDFDDHLQVIADEAIRQLHATLPLGKLIEADSLSRLGQHCVHCQYRPHCRRYNEVLDERMRANTLGFDVAPPDVSAKILNVSTVGELFTLKCEAPNGCTLSISGVPKELFGEIAPKPDRLIRAYGLGILDSKQASTFPCNFFVVDLEAPRNSAFEATVVLEP